MEKKSSIIAIGLTIHNTPVDVREKLAIPEVLCSVESFSIFWLGSSTVSQHFLQLMLMLDGSITG